jgi:hypothetical protein
MGVRFRNGANAGDYEHDLSDRELMDIGVTRGEIDCVAGHRAIDRLGDRTTYLWILSRGLM